MQWTKSLSKKNLDDQKLLLTVNLPLPFATNVQDRFVTDPFWVFLGSLAVVININT